MKVLAWNCNQAFRKKASFLDLRDLDFGIISEAENIDKLSDLNLHSSYWHGINPYKGLLVFSNTYWRFDLAPFYNPEYKYVIPLIASRNNETILLFAVWTQGEACNGRGYIGHAYYASAYYRPYSSGYLTIWAGDFNSNPIWDGKSKVANHVALNQSLLLDDIHSAYHFLTKDEPGKERRPTFYLYRHPDKPFHIDYIYLSGQLINRISGIEIGSPNTYLVHSDHMPLWLNLTV